MGIVEKVVKRTLAEIKLKNGKSALTLYGEHTHLHINPSGKFIIGGPQGDAGLTGRKMAKSIVKSGLAKRALVQLSYAIGVAKPLSLFVETYDSECGKLSADDITNVVKLEFDCRPGAIAVSLALREPKYQETTAYCHFGRAPYTKDGMKFFEWENQADLKKYAGMSSTQVSAELTGSNYLTKWVD